MATIGNVVVKILADTKQFTAGVGRARSKLARFQSGLTAAGAAISSFGKLAGAAAGAGFAVMIKRELQLIDSTVKLSKVLGSTVADLEGVRLAAQLGGSDVGQLDKGLKNLNKTIGETRAGLSTEGTEAFKLLGIDIEKIGQAGIVRAFVTIAEKLNEFSDLQVRAGIANKLFGRSGRELLITMQEMATGFAKVRNEAIAFGLDFEKVVGDKVQNLNDDIVRLVSTVRGLARAFAGLLSLVGIDRFTQRISSITLGIRQLLGQDTRQQEAAFKSTFGREPTALFHFGPLGAFIRGDKLSEADRQRQTRLLEQLVENSRITGTAQ